MQLLIWALLKEPVPADCPDDQRRAALTADVNNAFNELSRDSIFATITNEFGRYGTLLFQHYWPSLHSFYGNTGLLKYSAPDGSVHFLSSEEGTYQGDVWSSALFGRQPCLLHPFTSLCVTLLMVSLMWLPSSG